MLKREEVNLGRGLKSSAHTPENAVTQSGKHGYEKARAGGRNF